MYEVDATTRKSVGVDGARRSFAAAAGEAWTAPTSIRLAAAVTRSRRRR
jgi:hypothetical protein